MITNDAYGIEGASLVRGEPKPFVHEVIYTNDPIETVMHCLECDRAVCRYGSCSYIQLGEGRRKYKRKFQPPISTDLIDRVTRMWMDGWRKTMIARELGLTAYQVDRSLAWAEKEGLI